MVNRLWEQIFGNGIVETLEDFGTQGMTPTHKELLDWMAWQFMNDYNWSIKKMIKDNGDVCYLQAAIKCK